jgi:hypothetical protein
MKLLAARIHQQTDQHEQKSRHVLEADQLKGRFAQQKKARNQECHTACLQDQEPKPP